jgi:uncharacterized secreted protein with C-terminal beta-propeller domain
MHLNFTDYWKLIPPTLIETSIDLKEFGVNSIAWRYNEAVQAIRIIRESSWIILGIDAFELNNNHMSFFVPNFYATFEDLKTHDNIAITSSKALDYLEWQSFFGDQYLYDISATDKIVFD